MAGPLLLGLFKGNFKRLVKEFKKTLQARPGPPEPARARTDPPEPARTRPDPPAFSRPNDDGAAARPTAARGGGASAVRGGSRGDRRRAGSRQPTGRAVSACLCSYVSSVSWGRALCCLVRARVSHARVCCVVCVCVCVVCACLVVHLWRARALCSVRCVSASYFAL